MEVDDTRMIGDSLHLDKAFMQMNISVPVSRRSLLDYSENGDLFFSTRHLAVSAGSDGSDSALCAR